MLAIFKLSILAKGLQGLTGRSRGYSGQEVLFITTGCLTLTELKIVIKSYPGFFLPGLYFLNEMNQVQPGLCS